MSSLRAVVLPSGDSAGPDSKMRAVIIGGGMAGMCTAQGLAPLFDEVTIVERDPLTAGAVIGIAGDHPDLGQVHKIDRCQP